MFFELDRCDLCASTDIFKVPSMQTETKIKRASKEKPGKLVDEYIEQTKKEIKKEKRNLSKEEM